MASATLSGNSLRQTVHTHRASVHQTAKLVAALLMVARVTAGLVEKVMAAYRRVYDSRRLQADCQEPGSAPELIRSAIQMMHVSEWGIFNIGFIIFECRTLYNVRHLHFVARPTASRFADWSKRCHVTFVISGRCPVDRDAFISRQ